MGIADDVLALANNLGFARLFKANYKAYRGITLEFLSTLEVKRVNAVLVSLHFQLGNEPRELKVEELNALINTSEDASFSVCHNFDVQELWTQFCYMEEEEVPYYNPSHAKASSIRNPAFRYLYGLITSTILSRTDSGTCFTNDFHILIAATKNIQQDAECYLVDHMESQAYVYGSQQIGIGAMITPIAVHFKMNDLGDPVSTDIFLDRRSLQQQMMLHHDRNPYHWYWKLLGKTGDYLFSLPNPTLTRVMGQDAGVFDRWRLSSREHLFMMWRIDKNPNVQGVQGGEQGDERAEEEAEYEEGGEESRGREQRRGGFRMRAPDFGGFEQRFYGHVDAHHQESMDAQGNYYLQSCQWVQDQVGGVREKIVGLRNDLGTMRSQVDRIVVAHQDHVEEERWYREQERVRREQEQAQQAQYWNQEANYHRMVDEMCRSWPYYPEGHQPFDPQNPPPPPQ